jgi:hypothetical protein
MRQHRPYYRFFRSIWVIDDFYTPNLVLSSKVSTGCGCCAKSRRNKRICFFGNGPVAFLSPAEGVLFFIVEQATQKTDKVMTTTNRQKFIITLKYS